MAKPEEDGSGCCHLSCKSSGFGHQATSSLLVEKALTTCSLLVEKPLTTDGLLAFVGGTLVKESLAMIGLLAFVGGSLVKESLEMSCLLLFVSSLLVNMALAGRRLELEAVALVLPQGLDRPLPILVGTFRAGTSPKKNGPPRQFWRQQAGCLLVFAKCSLEPFLVAKGTTNIGWGIEF